MFWLIALICYNLMVGVSQATTLCQQSEFGVGTVTWKSNNVIETHGVIYSHSCTPIDVSRASTWFDDGWVFSAVTQSPITNGFAGPDMIHIFDRIYGQCYVNESSDCKGPKAVISIDIFYCCKLVSGPNKLTSFSTQDDPSE